jgi:hypothetical protein
MTSTVTALIELAVDHGFGVAFLVVGGQVLLDRLNPVEHAFAFLFGAKRSTQAGGAHRRERATQPSAASRFASTLTRDRNEPLCCTK